MESDAAARKVAFWDDATIAAVAKGAVTQRTLAIALKGPDEKWAGTGYSQVRALRRLVAAGIVARPPRFALTLHRKCRAHLTPVVGWSALTAHLAEER